MFPSQMIEEFASLHAQASRAWVLLLSIVMVTWQLQGRQLSLWSYNGYVKSALQAPACAPGFQMILLSWVVQQEARFQDLDFEQGQIHA